MIKSLPRLAFSLILLALWIIPQSSQVSAFNLPDGFENIELFGNLAEPAGMAFSPDGRLFIAERISGRLLVAKQSGNQWTLNAQPFYTFDIPKNGSGVPESVRSAGLRDIAFDPDFATNGFVYAFYMDNDTRHNRVIRLKQSLSQPDIADTTYGEELLIDLPFNSTSSSGSHNGGAIEFGPDGKLYITTGDGWEGNFAGDPVQSLSTFTGKVLRINPDGSVPVDNPFYEQASGDYRSIYALGLRNPYSMSINKSSGKLYVNEARGSNKASVYIVEAGANYGHEGGSNIGTLRSAWANASGAGSELITGGAWYPNSGPFPAQYHGGYFVALWGSNSANRGQISVIASESDTSVTTFEESVGLSTDPPVKPVITRIGPDGNLYYLLTTYQTDSGTLQMVRYTGQQNVAAPTISPNGGNFADPLNVALETTTTDAEIRYTLEGSEPTHSSTLYVTPIAISTNTLVKAKAFKAGLSPSSTSSASFKIGDLPDNIPPNVDAGEDRTVSVGQTVALDGSATTDPDGDDDLLRDELWTQLSGPPATIDDASEEIAYFSPQVAGTYIFQLEVSDGIDSGTDTVTFTAIDGQVCTSIAPLALYEFDEGSGSIVSDGAGGTIPLDLTVASGSPSWIPGALVLNSATLIQSVGDATKIIDTVKANNELSVELWIKAANVTQDGPARIVSLSGSATTRNLTIGQGNFGSTPKDTFSVRLRSSDPANDANGEPAIVSPSGAAKVALQHVVFTHSADGLSTLYVDGKLVLQESTNGDLSNWQSYPLLLGNEISGDRPWLGELHRLVFYACAVNADAVASRFAAGPDGPNLTTPLPPTPTPGPKTNQLYIPFMAQ